MLITKETEYAFLGLIALANKQEDVFYDVRALAQELSLPLSLLPKIFQKLAAVDIVESKFGPNGGFRLTRNPKEISLWQIFNAVQIPSVLKCYSGKATYCSGSDCPLKKVVSKIEVFLEQFLANTSLFELIDNKIIIKKKD